MDGKLADSPRFPEIPIHVLRITAQDLIPTHKDQRRREFFQITKQGGHQRVFHIPRIALCVKTQLFPRERDIAFQIGLKAPAGEGQIRPGGNGDNAAGQRQALLPQIQAQGEAQPPACAFPAEADFFGSIAFFQQVPISPRRILHSRREWVFGGQTIGGTENLGPALVRQSGAEAQGVLQAAAGIPAAVEIKNHPVPPGVVGQHPGPLKILKIMVLHPSLPMTDCPHKLPHRVLALPAGLQRAVGKPRFHMGQPVPHHIRR